MNRNRKKNIVQRERKAKMYTEKKEKKKKGIFACLWTKKGAKLFVMIKKIYFEDLQGMIFMDLCLGRWTKMHLGLIQIDKVRIFQLVCCNIIILIIVIYHKKTY